MTHPLCNMRDFSLLALSFSCLHAALFASAARSDATDAVAACPIFDAAMVVGMGLVLVSSATSLYASLHAWPNYKSCSLAVDVVGLVPGTVAMVLTQPARLGMGSLPEHLQHCSHEALPIALTYRMVGELLTYGSVVRLTYALGLGKGVMSTLFVICATFAMSGFSYIVAGVARDALAP